MFFFFTKYCCFNFSIGAPVKNVFFIRSGKCIVTRKTCLLSKGMIQVQIGALTRYDYFGEEGIPSVEASQAISDAALSTITASKSGEVEVGIISCYDAKNKISTIPINPIHLKSDGEVTRIYHEQLVRKAWKQQKKIFFDRMAQEKSIDPNMTAKKFKRIQAGKERKVWLS